MIMGHSSGQVWVVESLRLTREFLVGRGKKEGHLGKGMIQHSEELLGFNTD